jgi:hypothetical protein
MNSEPSDLAWSLEIARRMEELDSGKVKSIAWAEARRQISEMLDGRSGRNPVKKLDRVQQIQGCGDSSPRSE